MKAVVPEKNAVFAVSITETRALTDPPCEKGRKSFAETFANGGANPLGLVLSTHALCACAPEVANSAKTSVAPPTARDWRFGSDADLQNRSDGCDMRSPNVQRSCDSCCSNL